MSDYNFAYTKKNLPAGGRLTYFKHIWGVGGGGLNRDRGLIWEGGFFNLLKMMASVIHKELECKVEKLKYKKLEVMQPGIKNIFHLVNKQPSWIREERGAY